MRIWRQITHGSVERGRQRGVRPALVALVLALAFAPVCRGANTPDFRNFDHITTSFELLGQHRNVPCEACHANALFKGTPTACGACHGIGTAVRATAKPASHILSTDQCQACHTPWAWNPAVNFDHTQALGSCSTCHNGVQAQGKGPTHIVTDLECDVCHTTLSWAGAVFSHVGVTTGCAACHDGVHADGMVATHFPIGTPPTPCEGCHSTTNFTTFAGTVINHAAVTAMGCAACHETANYLGMHPSTNTAAGDSRPNATLDSLHPTTGDCGQCHDTLSFAGAALKPPNHIPTTAPCIQCHTNPAQNSQYSVTGVHQGVSGCVACHGPTVATTFVNVTIVTTPANHMPIGSLDCNGSGCHSTANVNPGGFVIGAANISSPTLTVVGHTTVGAAVSACQTCHETAPYVGMLASTATAAGDSRPNATLDAIHPATGDCGSCHTTTPTFATDSTAAAKPSNHIPTTAPCAQCHTTAGNNAVYSVTGTHQGVTGCLTCHGPTVGPFANVTIVTTSANHFPIATLDCNGSGCHSTANVNPGGFVIGAANISSPTLTAAGHATIAGAVPACQTCHETAPYTGMLASTATAAGDSRPSATLDAIHPATGDCGSCHTTTPTFATDATAGGKPANHIPTTAPCAQCHTTAGNNAVYSVSGTHQGVTGCLTCHGPSVATTFANVTIVTTSANHFPIGALDCNGSGCHSTANVNPGGFVIGTANVSSPTLTVAGHATIAGVVPACQTCHETAPYTGMLASTATTAGDSRPTALDKNHPTTGDCSGCHSTTPTFANDQSTTAEPANHIPTTAPCAQCHTTAGNDTVYSVTGTHQGVTGCLTCHGPSVATTFANVTIVTTPANHMPIGTLDCNGSGCHSTSNVNPGGFLIGAASTSSPTLTVVGHTTVAAGVPGCQTCHETAPYMGMIASTATVAGDSRPSATLDAIHPTTGDCGGCHTTTPTFVNDQTGGAMPANHIPTSAPCAQCHTTPGNNAVYSVTGVHTGVTGCLTCHGPTVGPFANVTLVTTSANHFPIGTLDCNGSGCHTTTNVTPGGFKLGTASISSPTLTVAGHATIAAAVSACQTCHETAPYTGMLASTATTAGDSRPAAALDANHPTTGDCSGCHTTTPTFAGDLTGAGQPANHIPTTAPCAQCHTTAGNYAAYSVTATHQGVTGCLTCHGPTVGPFANVTLVTTSASHFPIGTLDCNGSGCHTTTNVNPGGFKIGAANVSSPTLSVPGHTTIAGAVPGCQTCHETAPYTGMLASTPTVAGDSRPSATLDAIHPTTGDCGGCHTTTPTFVNDQTGNAKPSNHIPTTAPCAQCHTTAGSEAVYSVTGTHQGVTGCLTCHGPTVGPFANVTIVTTPANHFPIGTLDCNGSGCHSTTNVNPGGFVIGTANLTSPTLTVAGHTTVAAGVSACQACHETASYAGMLASTATTAGDSRPAAALDKNHPTTGDCSGCHTTTPTFANDQTATAEPANHIPTTAPCAQCHTTAGNDAVYSVSGTHQGVTGCLTCHGPTVATTFANVTIVSTPSNHMPIGTLDCNGSGCHSTTNVNPGGFLIGTASISSPTLTVAGHATIAAAVPACQTCHQTAAYAGMLASTATLAGDSRPSATLDALHPATGDCGSCHTTTPTFGSDMTAGSLPSGHIPTTAACAQCHTTANNYAQYSVTATHQGVSACLTCHGPTVGPFLNVTVLSTPVNHFPIGTLDCNGSGCHSTTNVNPGGFKLGTANPSSPTLGAAGHTTVEAGVGACATCHETAAYLGMTPSTATAAGDSRPTALDPKHPATGDCGNCHVPTPLFATNLLPTVPKPANHIPTTAPCSQCHTTAGNFAVYDVVGLHQGVTACGACHGPSTGPFAGPPPSNTIAIVGWPGSSHIPIGTLDCNGSGCHTTTNVSAGGFKIGAANLTSPTLTVAGHATIAGVVAACQTCHETAPYTGMLAGTATVAGDSRPSATLDANHPGSGDCGGCHTTTPTFAGDLTASSKPSNHIPTTAACTQCHTTANNYAAYSVTGTHQGVTGCLTCHGPTVATTFANVTIVSTSASHFPIGTLDCNGSGCHSTTNVSSGGFKIGAASVTAPTLTVAGHATIAGAVPACQTCHETAPYTGMLASTATTAGDSRPAATLDKNHPTTGDCSGCHTTTPTFSTDQTPTAEPANHIPTTAPCAQCHTTAGNNAVYSVIGTHQGVTACLTCHGPTVGPFANVTIVTTSASHFPIGTLDCNGSGCHSTINVNPGGFKLGTASISSPTLNVAGHTTIAGAVPACQTCHETAPYTGMVASTATVAGDSRPSATLDAIHPTTGDCGGCHTTTPVFAIDQTGNAKPSNHIPTTAPCAQCHTTAGNEAVYSVTGTHQGVTGCLTCHGPTVATTFANVTIVSTSASHFPIGTLDCNGSGCHSTTNVSSGGFKIGAASTTTPTLTVAGHATIAAAVPACQTCHETAPYTGMVASTATVAGDSRPSATLDAIHPTTGDCGGCHTTTPTFVSDQTGNAKPSNHIPTTAPCAQCHTTAGNEAVYSVTATHQGVTGCLTCHGPTVGPFANVTMVSTSASHFPIGTLDCNASGCHSTINVNPGGFKLGTASISSPTLTVTGHTTIAAAVPACQTCHETAPYTGMLAGTATTAGDSRPAATLDKNHPTTGDCGACHTTAPTFTTDQTGSAKPANHIPTTAACAQCHTTAGNDALYSVTGTHQGVTGCLTCHGSSVATTFANVTIVTTPSNHMPIGTLDCNGSGCHSTTNLSPGGFLIGAASITTPTLTVAGHTTIAAAVPACQTCHQTASYIGMIASTATVAGDSRPSATLDAIHPTTGDCGACHSTTPTFAGDLTAGSKPSNHIPTTAACAQCHTTANNYAAYSVAATHQGVTGCLTCHGPTVGPFANVTIVTTSASHFPIGTLDCNGSGCHSTTNVNPGGFKLGTASISAPTLTVAGHATIAGAVPACQTCHETAPYTGMLASTATVAGDSRPTATLDKNHPTTGDCGACHTTAPTFTTDQTGSTKPANHIPTTAACAQCHTTAGNDALYSVTGTHQGVTGCLTCHGPTVATTFANINIVTTSSSHMPIGSLDCNGSGCHTTTNVSTGGFKIGTANLTTPTLTVAGHTTIAGAVPACQTCHETAPYIGMLASTATAAGDSRPTAFDKSHPTTGDCGGCHTTAPTFTTDQTGSAKPANHIPTTAGCAQCHTTAGNDALYSVTGTHQGVTGCLTCHGPTVATTFANITIVTSPSNHMPIGSLDCNGSGCHTTTNVNPGGFLIGTANLTTPTLTVAGHATIATAVPACQTCHETAPYIGMLASTATAAGDSRPTAFDKSHPTTGDCNGCHTTTPTFTSDVTSASKPTNHIPTTAACTVCHTTAGNYAAYVMGATGHTGITNNCAQCHASGLSFYNMAPPTLVEPPAGATGHIPAVPPNGTKAIACELCHSPAVFTTFSGTVMKHATVTTMTCMSCHEYGMKWKTNTGVNLWTRPSPSHHAGVDCNGSGCHTSRDRMALRPAATPAPRATATAATATGSVAKGTATATGTASRPAPSAISGPFNHATVAGQACVSCHNGTAATGKPASHIATTNNCQSCHMTLAWLPVTTVDHSQVTGTCVSCHNGVTATGKPSRHVATTAGCNSCHTTNGWVPARFDHAAVAPHTCNTCHNGVQAIGMARAHLPTTQSCDTCHGTLAWTPALIDHSSFVGSCVRCHNNSAATGLPPNHFVTHLDCSSCHSYPDWGVSLFRHTAATYPGDHRAALSCSSCHTTNTEQVAYSAPAYAGSCAGCHAKDYVPAAHPKTTARGGPSYTVGELANCSGACHVYSDASLTTVARSQPGPRHRITDRKF